MSIKGFKFYDPDTNGTLDSGEPYVGSWPVYLYNADGSSLKDSTITDPYTGEYVFLVELTSEELAAGQSYKVSEVLLPTPPGSLPEGWQNTTDTFYAVTISSSTVSLDPDNLCGKIARGPDFGNVCLGKGGGLTLGFWSNKNGQKLVSSADLAFLTSLNLRNATGAPFDPANYAAFRTWLLSANATNMAYMLSAQLAAMELNVSHGFVTGNPIIYAPGTTSANTYGFATVNDIMAEANASLGSNDFTPAGNSERGHQEALKNALDKANNNQNFVQSGPCPPYTAVTPAP